MSKKWQLIFCFGWWDWDIVWKEYQRGYEKEVQLFYWWRFGPFELRIFENE